MDRKQQDVTAAERYRAVQEKIAQACKASGRALASVKVIAVSKTQIAEKVRELAALGPHSFGENYVQEALAKQEGLQELDWHFIGALQSNKAKQVVGAFSLIHSVDRLELAEKLHRAATAKGITQDCLIEINIDNEASKAGILESQLPSFLQSLVPLSGLRVQGLMCIPAANSGDAAAPFRKMRGLLELINGQNIYPQVLKELSMGMSDDFPTAIQEGATMIRIGTALFGPRPNK